MPDINVKIIESEPINVVINEGIPSLIEIIFEPEISGKRITKLQVKNGKLEVKYEE